MGKPIARRDDPHSHGGRIIEGSANVFSDGKRVARVGDAALCPLHGRVVIQDGSDRVFVNSRAAARVGSKLSCGATITQGDDKALA